MSQKNKNVETEDEKSVFNPHRWGLPSETIIDLADRLHRIWSRFRNCFTTRTRDTSEYAFVYLRGLLTMDTKRNYANIARRVINSDDDGQNIQHFMSDSPWTGQSVFNTIQTEICQCPELHKGILTLDESGDKRSGPQSAGTSRQYIGRLGKVELGQVGVALGYYQCGVWAMVDAELYLPEQWFKKEMADQRKRWHIPKDRRFATKTELGFEMIKRARANELPFEVITADSWYGRDSCFRADLADLGEVYIVDVPANTEVYLNEPVFRVPQTPCGKRGRPFKLKRVLNEIPPISARDLAATIALKAVEVRNTERGSLILTCAAQQVWTITEKGAVRQEWLVIWRKENGRFGFSLSNASPDVSLTQLAQWRSGRYFVERTFEDVKTEAGWDELVARKYRAFIHHTALDALALWFVAETKLDWAAMYPQDATLIDQLEVAVLPGLSMANIREMLKTVLPLKQLSPQQAVKVVINHLVARSRSTRCRLKAQSKIHPQGTSP